jgi:general secretion pathway protein N
MSTRGAKLLGLILAGACAVLFLLAIALQLGVGRGYTWLSPEEDAAPITSGTIDRTPFKLAPEGTFAATQARPLFNEDRKPTPDEPDDPKAGDVPPPVALNVALTGVVLTPDVRLAMVQDKAKNNAVALKEGMPMPGDQGGWMLTKINPRSAVFRDAQGEEIEVELSTAVANPKAGAPGRPATAAAAPSALPRAAPNQPGIPPQPQSSMPAPNQQQEALQRRIEERRKQMREEAERMKQQNLTPEQTREEIQRLQQQQPQQQQQ